MTTDILENVEETAMLAKSLRELRKKQKLSQVDFARTLGISQGYLSDLERGNKQPSEMLLIALTSRYGVLPGVEGVAGLSSGPAGAVPLLETIETQPFPGGVPGQPVDHVRVPEMAGAQFAITARGNFMSPTIVDGDLVLLVVADEATPGEIVLLNNNWGEGILRRYRLRDGEVVFSSDNSSYKSFSPTPETRMLAKVVSIWRRM